MSRDLKSARIVDKLEPGAGSSSTDKIADPRKGEVATLIMTRKGS